MAFRGCTGYNSRSGHKAGYLAVDVGAGCGDRMLGLVLNPLRQVTMCWEFDMVVGRLQTLDIGGGNPKNVGEF